MKSLTDSTGKEAFRVAWPPWKVLWLPMDWSREVSVRQGSKQKEAAAPGQKATDMAGVGLVAEVGMQSQRHKPWYSWWVEGKELQRMTSGCSGKWVDRRYECWPVTVVPQNIAIQTDNR